jgi:rubredoxin-NAD+ reductase
MEDAPVVIVGSGLAGYGVARELRKLAPDRELVIVSRDDARAYSKPSLSNALAAGKSVTQLGGASAETMAGQLRARVLANAAVRSIDIERRQLALDGQTLAYSKLVLALGADPISVPLEGNAADEVQRVNDLASYASFRATIEGRKRVVLLGAGLIGCEFANDLATAGYAVDLIDPAPHPLGRLLPAPAAERVRAALETLGVRWHLGTTATAVSRAPGGLGVTLANGVVLQTDAVLSAIGLRPRVDLARRAGLTVNRGIVTDRFLATSAADVYALGDCAEVDGQVLPFVAPIMHAARALACTLTGTPTAVVYPAMPVVVKTPAVPVVVAPPASAEGAWELDIAADGVDARFVSSAGALAGFALVGTSTNRKQALARRLPPVLA